MVEAGFQLVRRDGFDTLTARSLAAELGCSTQPIMYRFPDLAQLRSLVYQRADAYHTAYLCVAEDLLAMGLRYVRFAAEEPNLFRLLFQSEAGEFVAATSAELRLPQEDILPAFEALYVAVHGYASLVANNALDYDPTAIEKTLTAIAEGLMRKKDTSC